VGYEEVLKMILTIRTTTGRENVVIDSLMSRIKNRSLPIKSVFHPEDLRGYIFIEGENEDIEAVVKGIPHIRGLINKQVTMDHVERFIVSEKSEIKFEIQDIVEIIGGPFKGEKGKITRVDETKNEITVEFLEAAIPIPVTISMNVARMYEKKKKE
jgi:transcriptional antiterminator NusG